MKKALYNLSSLLSAFMLFAGFVFVGCTEGSLDDKYQVCPATLTLDKVTATTATFAGHLEVEVSDLSFSQVILYYSDAETLDMNAADSISVISFDDVQNFSVTLTNLKYGTKYNYCMVVKINSRKIFDDVRTFTTSGVSANLTVSESTIVSEKPIASFIGSVSGLPEEDMSLITFGVAYSKNAADAQSDSSTKITATQIDSEGAFTVSSDTLDVDTKYYFCSFVKQNDEYVYGEVKEFQTWQLYSYPHNLNISSATDLSSSASANCYIVSSAGLYKFKTVKGNSSESVGNVAFVSILWETFGTSTTPELFDLIKAFCYNDGYIAFQTADTFIKGNAVIAAKDANGNILWSWHIWLTDQPQGQEYFNNAGTMMDRNLGATSATPGDVGALGLLYQWGRKDPFLGSSSISRNITAKSTISWPKAVQSTSSTGTIDYATANPTTFIACNESNLDWYYTGLESTDNTRWTTSEASKSIYDPCPAGWRIPDGGSDGIWSKALRSPLYFYDDSNEGLNCYRVFGSSSTIWYPASGRLINDTGSLFFVASSGCYWSASAANRYYVNDLYLSDNNYVILDSSTTRAYGQSVRCVRE